MSLVQFSLFFAAVLIAYVLVHLRLARFESFLQRLVGPHGSAGLPSLDERLRRLAEVLERRDSAVDRTDIERFENGIAGVHDELREVVEVLSRIERAANVRREASALDAGASGVAGVGLGSVSSGDGQMSHALVVRRAVEATLFAMGYRKLKILTDLEGDHEPGPLDVVVECEREGMPVKGRLQVHGDAVLDMDLRSLHSMFP